MLLWRIERTGAISFVRGGLFAASVGWLEGIDEQDRPRCALALEQALARGEGFALRCHRRAHGRSVEVLERATPIFDAQGAFAGVVGVTIECDEAHTTSSLPPASLSSPGSIGPSSVPRGRVLVIDDEPAVGIALRRLLSREHDVTVVGSAVEGLAWIEGGARPDVVLCDLMMPEMTGMGFHAALGDVAPALVDRIVFVNGGAVTPAARDFLASVRNERLEKPIDAAELRALVRRLVVS